jgi:WD40 repeat protein
MAFAPDDRVLAVGGRSGKIRVWYREDSYRAVDYQPHSLRIRALAFSPDGRLLLSSGDDRKIHVRALKSGRGVDLPPRPAKVYALKFVAPRYLAAGGSDNLIRIWDLSNATEVGRLEGHEGSVATLDCNSDILVSGGYDTVVRVWMIKDRVAKLPGETRGLK